MVAAAGEQNGEETQDRNLRNETKITQKGAAASSRQKRQAERCRRNEETQVTENPEPAERQNACNPALCIRSIPGDITHL